MEYLDALKHPALDRPANSLRPVSSLRAATVVPALGRRVRGGKPTFDHDYQAGAVDLGMHLVRDPSSTFVMKVDGWSMRDAGIADGDELIVDRGVTPNSGRIVVAEIDGELTVKRLKRTDAGWLLQASNPDLADVAIGDTNNLHIWGVVTRVLHTV